MRSTRTFLASGDVRNTLTKFRTKWAMPYCAVAFFAMALLQEVPAFADYVPGTMRSFWQLNDESGAAVFDLTGNGNNGILRQGPTLVFEDATQVGTIGVKWAPSTGPAIAPNALHFAGVPQPQMAAPASASLNFTKSQGTIAFWVRTATPTVRQVIFKDSSGGSTVATGVAPASAGMEIQLHTSGKIFFSPNRADGAGNNYFATDSPIPANTWTHVAFVFDQSLADSDDNANPNKVKCYLNGVAVSNSTSGLVGDPDTLWTNTATTQDWIFGMNPDLTVSRPLVGDLADVAVYNTPLSPADISDIYSAGVSARADLVANWKFSEGSGTTTADASGNGNTGYLREVNQQRAQGPTFAPANPTAKPSYLTNALGFDATNDFFTANNSGSLNFDKTSGTLVMWLYLNSLGRQGIIGENNGGITLQVSSSNRLAFDIDSAFSPNATFLTPTATPFLAGQWVHVACVWNKNLPASGDIASPNKVKMYWNGIAQTNSNGANSPDTAWTSVATTGDWTVGRRHAVVDVTNPRWMDGQIADVAVFSQELSSADIMGIKNYGVAAFLPPSLDLNGPESAGTGQSLAYRQDSAVPILLTTADATTSQPYGAKLTWMTVTINGRLNGASELLDANVSGTPGISKSFDSGTGVLTLSGSDTIENYTTAMRTVTYQNTDGAMSAGQRTIAFVASTGAANSPAENVLLGATVPVTFSHFGIE